MAKRATRKRVRRARCGKCKNLYSRAEGFCPSCGPVYGPKPKGGPYDDGLNKPIRDRCGCCRWFDKKPGAQIGVCRQAAPFSVVMANDWCSKWVGG